MYASGLIFTDFIKPFPYWLWYSKCRSTSFRSCVATSKQFSITCKHWNTQLKLHQDNIKDNNYRFNQNLFSCTHSQLHHMCSKEIFLRQWENIKIQRQLTIHFLYTLVYAKSTYCQRNIKTVCFNTCSIVPQYCWHLLVNNVFSICLI